MHVPNFFSICFYNLVWLNHTRRIALYIYFCISPRGSLSQGLSLSLPVSLSQSLSLPVSLPLSLHSSRIWQLWDYNETTVSQSQARSKAVIFIVNCTLSPAIHPSAPLLLCIHSFIPLILDWMSEWKDVSAVHDISLSSHLYSRSLSVPTFCLLWFLAVAQLFPSVILS